MFVASGVSVGSFIAAFLILNVNTPLLDAVAFSIGAFSAQFLIQLGEYVYKHRNKVQCVLKVEFEKIKACWPQKGKLQ
jgi:hypothetical protein